MTRGDMSKLEWLCDIKMEVGVFTYGSIYIRIGSVCGGKLGYITKLKYC